MIIVSGRPTYPQDWRGVGRCSKSSHSRLVCRRLGARRSTASVDHALSPLHVLDNASRCRNDVGFGDMVDRARAALSYLRTPALRATPTHHDSQRGPDQHTAMPRARRERLRSVAAVGNKQAIDVCFLQNPAAHDDRGNPARVADVR